MGLLKKKFNLDPDGSTYVHTISGAPENHIEVEVGDIKSAVFQPQTKIKRWHNKVNLSIRLKEHFADTATITNTNGVVSYKKSKIETRHYALDAGAGQEDGGHEFEVWLSQKPASNVLTYSVRSKGVDFFYQPPLTQTEIDAGAVRPDNVIGSYAVYCTDLKHNYEGGDHYATGKFCHIYRPWAKDANGTQVWCDLWYDSDVQEFTVTVPMDFLESAVYPVLVDPTFGYTSIGGSNGANANSSANDLLSAGPFTASAGTLTSISIYTKAFGAGENVNLCLYDDSSGSPHNLVAGTQTGGQSISTTAGWITASATGTLSAVPYWIGSFFDNGASKLYYDFAAPNAASYTGSPTYPTFPSTFASPSFLGIQMSIYGTVSAAGGTTTSIVTPIMRT